MGRLSLPWSVRREFWESVAAGKCASHAAVDAGVHPATGKRWFVQAGGVKPPLGPPSRRELSLLERTQLKHLAAQGLCNAEIARQMGRHRSTIGRELARNSTTRGYLPAAAHERAAQRARRPKPAKLVTNTKLRTEVIRRLTSRHSPEQIAARLRRDFPDEAEMRVSHETIYQAIYVQARGGLKKEILTSLRTGRTLRAPRRREQPKTRRGIKGMVNISERPPEVADRAVPGHWEGDLIIGSGGTSAIGTLVERTTRFTMLLHLPAGHTSFEVQQALTAKMVDLPELLRRSLTWDQGTELARHAAIALDLGLDVYFCDPHSPWQRGTNENTNGLLRQYFPKHTDLSVHGPGILDNVATELNARPRKVLDWSTPAEALDALLSNPSAVA
jgi:transposase, IS30 family